MLILGFNAYHPDVAAVILRDGQLIGAVEEERFRRIKHWAGFPQLAIQACLDMAGARAQDIDYFAVPRARRAHLWRKALFAVTHRPGQRLFSLHHQSAARRRGLAGQLADTFGLDEQTTARRMYFVEHHPAHLASAFFASRFEEAALCSIDGFGDFVSTSIGVGSDASMRVLDRVFFPHSLGLLYSALTQHLGFLDYGDEYKVMGLAPYGTASMTQQVSRLVTRRPHGRFELDLRFFRHWSGDVGMTWDGGRPVMSRVLTPAADELLGPPRDADAPVEDRHRALAASLQHVFEDVVMHILDFAHQRTGSPNLCLAGGCAMNSVANGKIRSRTPFREIYVQPAASDSGTALGAALATWHLVCRGARLPPMDHAAWGTAFDDDAIRRAIEESGVASGTETRWSQETDRDTLCGRVADYLASGLVVGWFQGRMEWGARALGNRSILADPRRSDMRDVLNERIKRRESFRPFAPSIVEEALDEYFVDARADPFMQQVYPVRPEKRAVIPAVTHVDGSARAQSVSRATNELFWTLLKAFEQRTGVPVLLNTSFNENEPIVQTPQQAVDCFARTRMDVLVMGRHILERHV